MVHIRPDLWYLSFQYSVNLPQTAGLGPFLDRMVKIILLDCCNTRPSCTENIMSSIFRSVYLTQGAPSTTSYYPFISSRTTSYDPFSPTQPLLPLDNSKYHLLVPLYNNILCRQTTILNWYHSWYIWIPFHTPSETSFAAIIRVPFHGIQIRGCFVESLTSTRWSCSRCYNVELKFVINCIGIACDAC